MKNIQNLTKTFVTAALMLAVFLCAGMAAYAVDVEFIGVTPSTGDYTFDDLPIGTYDVLVSADGYYSKTTTATIEAVDGRNNVIVNVELDEITEGTITATIKDGNGNPVINATVAADEQVLSSDENGIVVFNPLPIGNYGVLAVKDGYYSNEVYANIVALEGGENVSIDIVLNSITEGNITATIKDEGGNLLENATVTIDGNDILTDGNGKAIFTKPIGSYAVSAYKTGYYTNGATTEIFAIEGDENADIEIVLTAITKGSVSLGEVKDEDGNPLEDVTITIDGYDDLSDLPEGSHTVVVEKDGYYTEEVEIEISYVEGQDEVVIDIVLRQITSGSITVIVVDSEGLPIDNATVNIKLK